MGSGNPNAALDVGQQANLGLGAGPSGGTETILLVEDNSFVRDVTHRVLESAGYSVVAATSATEALALRESLSRLDLLVIDVVLPGKSGCVLAKTLRSLQPGLRVLFVTGYPLRLAELQKANPKEACLAKPFSAAALLEKVRQMLSERVWKENVLNERSGDTTGQPIRHACAIV